MNNASSAAGKAAPVGETSLHRMQQMLKDIDTIVSPGSLPQRGGPRIDDLKKLLEISQAINSTLDLDRILEMVMKYAIDLVTAERGIIMLVENGQLVTRQVHNQAPEQFGPDAERISQTIANRVLETGESIYTSDALDDPRFDLTKSVADLHLRSIMGVPLKNDGQVTGLIYLDNSSQGRIFLQSDLYILELLSQQAAIAVANARLVANARDLQEYAESIVSSTPVALLVLDSLSKVRDQNDRGRHILHALGASPESGVVWLDLVPTESREEWAALIRGVLESGNAHTWSRHRLTADGETRTYRVLVSPLVKVGNVTESLVLTLDDITDAERMSEQLAKAAVSIQKADQIGDVAHEMNNFLTVIYTQTQVFQSDPANSHTDRMAGGLRRIRDASEKLIRLVEALLRPERMEPEPQTFKLHTIFESLETMISAERRFERAVISFDIPPDLPPVVFDPAHLEMVFYNICKNAVEAMEAAGSLRRVVEVTARLCDHMVEIRLQDSGPGLPPDRQQNPWGSGHSTKSTGHGRGLHNTATFVENNGGTIVLWHQPPLGGAGFKIRIPVQEG
jgi:signal transduction histidine kinase